MPVIDHQNGHQQNGHQGEFYGNSILGAAVIVCLDSNTKILARQF
jgi:hypothetical protein